MEKDIEVTQEGTTLSIKLGKSLSTTNAPALVEELKKYSGQSFNKITFDATQLLFLSSSGIRAIVYAKKYLLAKDDSADGQSQDSELVFINCAKIIKDTLDLVGFSSSIKYVNIMDNKTMRQQKSLEDFAANNDVVLYNMRLGAEDE